MYRRSIRLALAAFALAAFAQAHAGVTPPPLPIGSNLVRPMPGMSEPEIKRAERAHHHKFQNGKDYTRDDSVYGHESVTGTRLQPVATRPGGTAAPVGGAGTGPAREKTDKGASSYFFGPDNKKK